jgi:hypothetical protein
LIQAPDLPATELEVDCYREMFAGCTSLEEKARIPKSVELNNTTAYVMYDDCPCNNGPQPYIED